MAIPYGRQTISDSDIQAVVDVLQSDYLTQGPAVPRFEQAVADRAGAVYAVAFNSATSALHLACLALGLRAGDRLWTTPITFVASANCALYCGADVDFVDIDPHTFNMSVQALELKLQRAEQKGRLPKIVVPVHFGGLSCDMEAIARLARQYGFFVIEDASHAIGGQYRNKHIGHGAYSDITVFSFHPVKIITTAEGGVAVTNNRALAEKMSLLRSHGITRNPEDMTQAPDGPWYYQQIALGFNYRLTDLQAALGVSQLDKLSQFVERRHQIAERYRQLMADFPIVFQHQPADCYSAMHLFVVRLSADRLSRSHRQIFEQMRASGIGVNLHYIPVHLQPYYKKLGFNPGDFPEAEKYYREAISLPMFPGLTDQQVEFIADVFRRVLS